VARQAQDRAREPRKAYPGREQDIFPRIKKVWDEIRLKQAGTAMKAMKLKPTAARRVA
jgi:hypothetical protein